MTAKLNPVVLNHVAIKGGFWGARVETNRTATLPIEYDQLKKTGRLDVWKLDWKEGQQPRPHIFWDSDIAKWIEAAAYSLSSHPDPGLEQLIDQAIDLMENAQQPDGYMNTYFTIVEPDKRWANLRDWHELYCAGHLMEGAVAYFQATGKRQFLDIMCRYADHIDRLFGPGEGQKPGYPGHPEIELGLVKLYRATGEERYLKLSKFFVDERGRQPHYYDLEARQRGEDPKKFWARTYQYNQSHRPIREQTEVVGHAVRACYLYAGAADIAAETGDETLLAACRRLWENLTQKRMYITAGIGPVFSNEGFTFDYDLPNDTAYAETCASIALVFWAHRMAHLELDSRYADAMELALYNGILSGVSLDGETFFYANPLAAYPEVNPYAHAPLGQSKHYRRSEWFDCACCPPNLARLLASLGQYVYSAGANEIYVHLYVQSKAELSLGGQAIQIEQQTDYPWDEVVRFTVQPERPAQFILALRVPGWCRGAGLKVNGQALDVAAISSRGYAKIDRAWRPGDQVELTLPMPVERMEAHPKVRQDAGRIALQRGPLVYCLEEVDNGPNLADVVIPAGAEFSVAFDPQLLGGVAVISGDALRRDAQEWQSALYRPAGSKMTHFTFKAIPYYAWANRQPGEMQVWLREG
jgi:DUF1680 family protein